MIYFCADDYGVSKASNDRIEKCLKNGVLNKISVLPNGEIDNFKERLSGENVKLSLHINLVEGAPLSSKDEVNLLVSNEGFFKYSFIGLFFRLLSKDKKELEKQIYKELKNQIAFWKEQMGENTPLHLDSHQHTHMIPLIFRTLMRVIKDEKINVEYIRIPAEPIIPYIKSPSLYFSFSIVGIIKQWLLKFLNLINRREFKKSNLNSAKFLGIIFSGKLTEEKINKLLPYYQKYTKDIEMGFHPGYLENNETLIDGCKPSFEKFYYSDWRKKEYDALINLKQTKEGKQNVLY